MGRILFQVGDRVKLVESSHQHLLGKTYTIVETANTQCKIEDINGNTLWVGYNEIKQFYGGEEKPKSVEQYKEEVIRIVQAMNREHGMNVSTLQLEIVASAKNVCGGIEDVRYKVTLLA